MNKQEKISRQIDELRDRLKFRIREFGLGFLEEDVERLIKFQMPKSAPASPLADLLSMTKSRLKAVYKKLIDTDTDFQRRSRNTEILDGKEVMRQLKRDPLHGE